MRIWGRILAAALIVALLLGGMAMAEEQDEALSVRAAGIGGRWP